MIKRYFLIASIVLGNLMLSSTALKAQSCDFQISPDADCYSRLSTQTNSAYGDGSVEFKIIDSGNGGLDYNWYKITNNQCWGTGHFAPDYTVPADGSAYKVTVSQGSLICMIFSFSASAPAPPPAPVPLTPHLITCSSGPSTLQMPPGPGYNWKESNGAPLLSGAMYYLSTGEAYFLNTAESDLTIYHGPGPKSYSFSVRNGDSMPASLTLSVVTNQIVITAPDMTRCGDGTVILSASGANLTDFRWYKGSQITSPGWKTGPVVESEPLSDLITSSVYLVTAKDQYGCFGSKEVTVTRYPLPPVPEIADAEFCAWEAVRISPANGGVNNWYDVSPAMLVQSKAALLKLPPFEITGQFQYQAEAVSVDGCVSPRKTFTINVPSDCDHRLNWIHQTSYDVAGTVGETFSYFDDVGGSLQAQSKNFTSGQVLASQSIKDQYGRSVISTLAAPVNQTFFRYKHWFVTNNAGKLYDHTMIGSVVGKTIQGTLGWYYSANNSIEVNAPKSGYPYSRHDYYEDGTGEVRRSTSPGDALQIGSGHEVLSGTFPVFNELNDYISKRTIALAGIVQDGSLKNEALQSVTRDGNGRYAISISDKSGKTVMTCRPGTAAENALTISNSVTSSGNPASVNYRPMTYFYLLSEQPVTITGSTDFVVENIVTNQRKAPGATFVGSNGKWPEGFYRILLANVASEVTMSYTQYFRDVSYQFYDDSGRLRSSVSPNGCKAWCAGTSDYADIDKTTYHYNYQGRLLKTVEPDAGKTQYVYRNDGKIRFSQNAEQKKANRFSYTHYDRSGRPVESGEYTGTAVIFIPMDSSAFGASAMKTELEKTDKDINWTSAEKKDWVRTHYDQPVATDDDPATTIPNLPPSFRQDFVNAAVSWTENVSIKTWYSYDELGRVTWMAQKPTDLNRTFLIQYTYDFLGNVISTQNTSFVGGNSTGTFFHHYEYDADRRLNKVFTSTNGSDKKLRATYEYYLHGPLKRVELGDEIQGIDFVYNIQGWLTQINHPDKLQDPGHDDNDVFGMVLDYYESALPGLISVSSAIEPNKFHHLPDIDKDQTGSNDRTPDHTSSSDIRAMIRMAETFDSKDKE